MQYPIVKSIVIDGNRGAGTSHQVALLEKVYPQAHYSTEIKQDSSTLLGTDKLTQEQRLIRAWHDRRDRVLKIHRRYWPYEKTYEKVVVHDGFDSSTFAYFVHGKKQETWLKKEFLLLRKEALGVGAIPSHYFILLVDPVIGLKRISHRIGAGNGISPEKIGYYTKTAIGYRAFKKSMFESTGGITFIDANRPILEIHADLVELTKPYLWIEPRYQPSEIDTESMNSGSQ